MRLRGVVRAAENKYNRLLTLITIIYLASPFLMDWSLGNVITVFLFFGAIIAIIYQIRQSLKILGTLLSLILIVLVIHWLNDWLFTSIHFGRISDIISTIILIIFLALSIYLITYEIIGTKQVTSDIIKGGICVYFLLGFIWTAMYEVVFILDPHSFSATTSVISRSALNHFSFTTLTTVGYGDISPASEVARVLANLQGMVGVLYPTVFIARLVGLHNNH